MGISRIPVIDQNSLNNWISFAIMQNLKELHTCFVGAFRHIDIPSQIFTASPIAIFILRNDSFPNVEALKLPQAILSAPNLSTLELCGVEFPKSNSQGVVVFTCLLLESFVLRRISHGFLPHKKKDKLLVSEQCSLHNLKYAAIRGIRQGETETKLEFLRFLLKYATRLNRMTFKIGKEKHEVTGDALLKFNNPRQLCVMFAAGVHEIVLLDEQV
ncbi:hypothetical protein Scep_028528 [Stephania cephalantha]|uniref:FBD domain-containing protein n=1 Tax=Stephania cephalantha TaxID=152367 RepID=A0AAP0HM60_9MAGN